MDPTIVGRADELHDVEALLDATSRRPTALVIEGVAGIGKSTLWLAGCDHARDRGWQVLATQPSAAEGDLAFVGLGDLFDSVAAAVLPALTPPRRRAMEGALLLDESSGPVDSRALGVAVRDALVALAGGPPVLVAIDDEQWLDGSTADALGFALRRLDAPVRLLLARRAGPTPRAALASVLARGDVVRIRIGPLDLEATRRLIEHRLGRTFDRPTVRQIHATAGGNAFYALEIARALPAEVDPTALFPIPDDLDTLMATRLDVLPPDTRPGLALVAASGGASWVLLETAGIGPAALAPALRAQVLEQRAGGVRFAHPLLASMYLHRLSDRERRQAHATLARLVADPAAAARHLALATSVPDEDVAATVERGAAAAQARGATAAAVELQGHARRLTPPDDGASLDRRSLAMARGCLATAAPGRVGELVAGVLERNPSGPQRAAALLLACEAEADPVGADALLREALVGASGDTALECHIRRRLGSNLRMCGGLAEAVQHLTAALASARRLGDPSLIGTTLATLATARIHLGDPGGFDDAAAAHELAAANPSPALRAAVGVGLMPTYVWTGEHDRLRGLLEPVALELADRDELAARDVLLALGLCELAAGRFAHAAAFVLRSEELGAAYGEDHFGSLSSFALAIIDAHRGDLDSARRSAERARHLADACTTRLVAGAEGALGLVAAWSGQADVAVGHFTTVARLRQEMSIADPSFPLWRAEFVDTLVILGRHTEAADLLDAWEAESVGLGHRPALALARRSRGMVAAAAGDLAAATAHLEAAAVAHRELAEPFGEARALLALGTVRRRGRQKQSAAFAIDASLVLFEQCGADGWTRRASAERGTIGGRTRQVGLTAAEKRVTDLVVAGHTNREVAATLFLGERTVETHLSHAYAKLGVRSRTELVRVLTAR